MDFMIGLVFSTAGIALVLLCSLALLGSRSINSRRLVERTRLASPESLTFRITNIPRDVIKDSLHDILVHFADVDDAPSTCTLLGYSYSPAAANASLGRYWVATATFAPAPRIEQLERALKRGLGPSASRLKVDIDFLGVTQLADASQEPAVDIVAVTGLAGHAFGSWKTRGGPDMWLRDFLPNSVPNARILTYGYDTRLPGSQSEASIPEMARRLLESLQTVRSEHARERPIIFIAHSLGGLVVKQALVSACEGSPEDKAIFMACSGLLFFAVPHRGMDIRSLQTMVRGQPNQQLVDSLSTSSRFASLLQQRFKQCFTLEGSKIISVYETLETPTVQWSSRTGSWERTGPKVMMVQHTSAMDAGQDEKAYDQLSINADHSNIVKFSDPSNQDYRIIERRIKSLATDAPRLIQERFESHNTTLSRAVKDYLNALGAPDFYSFRHDKVKNPTSGTLGWFLENKQFQAWRDSNTPSLLWIKGAAGQGKTTLAKFILNHLETPILDHRRPDKVIYFFFYDQDSNLRTVGAFLRSLISQLISAPGAFQAIDAKLHLDLAITSESYLWKILEELLRIAKFDAIYCAIDAVDECQDRESIERLTSFIKMLLAHPASMKNSQFPLLKFLLLSRPTVDLSIDLKGYSAIHLKADSQDLATFIKGELQRMDLSPQLEENMYQLLANRVEETFLWVSIVLRNIKLRITPLTSLADIEQILSEMPSDLSKLYEAVLNQIIQRKQLPVLRLLVWVAFGRRSLALRELNEALAIQKDSINQESLIKYKSGLTKDAIISAAGTILDVDDNERVYLIHQSAKDFLLKSQQLVDAACDDGLHPDVYLAKSCIKYLCFEDFRSRGFFTSATLEERADQYPFLMYASRNWHRHIINNDDINLLASEIHRLTQPGSPTLLTWGYVALIPNLDEAEQIWDVAIKARIPWLAELQSQGGLITQEVVMAAKRGGFAGQNHLRTLLGRRDIHISVEAARLIVNQFDYSMLEALKQNHDIPCTPLFLRAAIENEKDSIPLLGLLLEGGENRVIITKSIIELAQKAGPDSLAEALEVLIPRDNVYFSEAALTTMLEDINDLTFGLLTKTREDIVFGEGAVRTILRRFTNEMVAFFLERHGQQIKLTKEVLQTAAGRRSSAVMRLLFKQRGQEILITEEVVETAAAAVSHRNERVKITEFPHTEGDVIDFLFEQWGQEVPVTEAVAEAAANNYGKGLRFMKLLFDQRGQEVPVTERVVKAAASNWGEPHKVLKLLFDQRGPEVPVTEEVVKEALGNRLWGLKVMQLFFEQRGKQVPVTEEVVEAAAYIGCSVLELLFDQRGQEVPVTEKVVKAAAGNSGEAHKILKLLFDQRGPEVPVTEEVVKEALRKDHLSHRAVPGRPHQGLDVLTLLFEQKGQDVPVTEEIVETAAGHLHHGLDILKLLLDQRHQDIPVTEEVVKAAAGRRQQGLDILQLLFDQLGQDVPVTEEVVKVAAGRRQQGLDILKLLFDQLGQDVPVTEEVVKAAAGNDHWGLEVIQLLFDQRGPEIPVTEEVVKVAASRRLELVELLFDQSGQKVPITEEVVKAAAGNWNEAHKVLKFLFKQRGQEVPVTEEVVKVAASRHLELVELLFDQRGQEVPITEEVVKAAAGNDHWGLEVIQLLFDQRGQEVPVTEDVVIAAAGNSPELIELLFDQRGQEVPITEEVVKAATGNSGEAYKVLKLLFDQRGQEVPVTEDVVIAAVRNYNQGPWILELLFNQRDQEVPVTEEVVKAAAAGNRPEPMELLFDQRGQEVPITEEVVKAVVCSFFPLKVLEVLFDKRGQEILVTEEVVKTVARYKGFEVMQFLFEQRGQQVPVTEEVVKTVALYGGFEVMQLLFDQRGQEVPVTEEVVKAAAGTNRQGLLLMQLLLTQRGQEVPVTEEVVKEAAGNEHWGLEVIQLLFKRRGKQVPVTEEVFEAAKNNSRGFEIRRLLSEIKGEAPRQSQGG